MTTPIALYLNLENTLIPRVTFPELLATGKESYFAAIKDMDPRICLVAPAKDWVMLAIANPRLVSLINKRGICILPTLFSHVLPDTFPETLDMQYKLSSDVLKKLFKKNFLAWNNS